MKIKTIEKVINDKINEWIESVTDNDIKKIIKSHSIVTGGCIASMLLREEVNDFDVYLDSKESVKKVSDYYLKKINSQEIELIDGENYKGFLYNTEGLGYDIQFAGISHQKARCCSNLCEDRIKIFFPDKGIYLLTYEEENKEKYKPMCLSANAITLSDKIQIVIRFHGKPEEIHKNYDFVHATNYWYNGKLVINQPALESLITKELRYIGSKYPITSVIRSKKFVKRGFTISAGMYLKICYQISELNLTDLVVLEDQLAGVDVAYFNLIIEALQTKQAEPEFNLSYEYLAELIDRIFE